MKNQPIDKIIRLITDNKDSIENYKENKVSFEEALNKLKYKHIFSNEIMPLIDKLNPHDFEKIIAETYKKLGFRVKITKGSHDYGVDVFAEKGKDKICIQAKLYLKQKVNLKAVQEIYTAKGIYKCNTAVVITNAKFQKSATISANKLQVLLIGRKKFKKMVVEAFDIYSKENI